LANILEVKQLTEKEKLFKIQICDKDDCKEFIYKPGQFVEVSIFGFGEAPISITSAFDEKPGNFELCVRDVGSLTSKLHSMKPGDTIGIRGPFGNGFPMDKFKNHDVLVVAGGIGLAPLRSLIGTVIKNRNDYGKFIVMYGTKSPAEILFADEIESWKKKKDMEFLMTVDNPSNGWKGNIGVITTLFEKLELDAPKTVVAICGPPVMYKFVVRELVNNKKVFGTQIFMSLERKMKCGINKCGHCAIGSKHVCKDGPVFDYREILQLKEAI